MTINEKENPSVVEEPQAQGNGPGPEARASADKISEWLRARELDGKATAQEKQPFVLVIINGTVAGNIWQGFIRVYRTRLQLVLKGADNSRAIHTFKTVADFNKFAIQAFLKSDYKGALHHAYTADAANKAVDKMLKDMKVQPRKKEGKNDKGSSGSGGEVDRPRVKRKVQEVRYSAGKSQQLRPRLGNKLASKNRRQKAKPEKDEEE